MSISAVNEVLNYLDHSVVISDGKAVIKDEARLKASIHRLAEISALETGARQGAARYIVRLAALAFGAVPASIHELYMARGKGDVPHTFTVPAMNLRMLAFDAARAVFRAAGSLNAGAFIFEIARSEMGYTDQRPAEFVTSVLAAAIAEGYKGPVFIQGDHFQVSAKRYASDAETELKALRELISEAVAAGFYNIDIDTSTLVDINKPTVPEQQDLNSTLSAMFTAYIRSVEPEGVTISIGGEIGEVGGHNSTAEELSAYMEGYKMALAKEANGAAGLSKISIQTGTSHGGVVLPDGSIAKVAVDFETLLNLGRLSRSSYGAGGTVQHGASTLPEDAFGKFVESEALEVHLATNFQNIAFDLLPGDLRQDMYAYLDEKNAADRKPDMTSEQFYYKTRKNAIGPFKVKTWNMKTAAREQIGRAWEAQFLKLFKLLGIKDSQKYVAATVTPKAVKPSLKYYLGAAVAEEDVSDLAD